ncbi:MAG: flagellar basal body P-ring protein FlgI [Alphaproteobacteria bacterium]
MKAPLLFICLALAALLAGPAAAASRIKDLTNVEGLRENPLVGYGLVVGLDGSGDSLKNAPFTRQSLQAMLERLGVNIRDEQLNAKNVAAVMVTANLPPFATQGTRIDVNVSALGDAKSLRGGTLLVTPLMGADGQVYAVAQGSVAVGGFSAEGDGGSVKQGVTTNGGISNGAIIEREIAFALNDLSLVRLPLRNPDFTTAVRIADAINGELGGSAATAVDNATIKLDVPASYKGNVVALLTKIEQLPVEPDLAAKVVIDENRGIIVMGQNVRVSRVAIAQGSLTISVTEAPQVSQPSAFAEKGETKVVPRTTINVDTGKDKKLGILNEGVSLQVLVDGLNALGIGPRDMISILQNIKAAGALQAEIEVR